MISVLSCYCSLVFTLLSGVIHYTKSTLNSALFFGCLNQIYLSLCSTQKLMKKMALIVNIRWINQSFILREKKPRSLHLHAWVYTGRSLLKYTICAPRSAEPLHPHPLTSTLICLLLSGEKCSNNEWLLFTEVISCYISIIARICLASQASPVSLQWTFKGNIARVGCLCRYADVRRDSRFWHIESPSSPCANEHPKNVLRSINCYARPLVCVCIYLGFLAAFSQ